MKQVAFDENGNLRTYSPIVSDQRRLDFRIKTVYATYMYGFKYIILSDMGWFGLEPFSETSFYLRKLPYSLRHTMYNTIVPTICQMQLTGEQSIQQT